MRQIYYININVSYQKLKESNESNECTCHAPWIKCYTFCLKKALCTTYSQVPTTNFAHKNSFENKRKICFFFICFKPNRSTHFINSLSAICTFIWTGRKIRKSSVVSPNEWKLIFCFPKTPFNCENNIQH